MIIINVINGIKCTTVQKDYLKTHGRRMKKLVKPEVPQ